MRDDGYAIMYHPRFYVRPIAGVRAYRARGYIHGGGYGAWGYVRPIAGVRASYRAIV